MAIPEEVQQSFFCVIHTDWTVIVVQVHNLSVKEVSGINLIMNEQPKRDLVSQSAGGFPCL